MTRRNHSDQRHRANDIINAGFASAEPLDVVLINTKATAISALETYRAFGSEHLRRTFRANKMAKRMLKQLLRTEEQRAKHEASD